MNVGRFASRRSIYRQCCRNVDNKENESRDREGMIELLPRRGWLLYFKPLESCDNIRSSLPLLRSPVAVSFLSQYQRILLFFSLATVDTARLPHCIFVAITTCCTANPLSLLLHSRYLDVTDDASSFLRKKHKIIRYNFARCTLKDFELQHWWWVFYFKYTGL